MPWRLRWPESSESERTRMPKGPMCRMWSKRRPSKGATGLVLRVDDGFSQGLVPTPACHDGDEPTVHEDEGPFFKPRSPQRGNLREPGVTGRPVELSGLVLTRSCRPV